MNKKIVGSIIIVVVVAIVVSLVSFQIPTNIQEKTSTTKNQKLGLIIFPPNDTPTLSDLKEAYSETASTGIGRNNIYLSWAAIEPQQDQYNWKTYDALMNLNKQNDLKVTLYFSIINSRILGPFPDWMDTPDLDENLENKTIKILDDILSRYDVIDYVITGGEIDTYFREHESDIPKYGKFFNTVYTKLKEKHPDIKFGNSFSLHGILNHNQEDLVGKLNQGDFIAFTYAPVNTLNEISKTPIEATKDLEKILDLSNGKKIALMEVSWSTSKTINGTQEEQVDFMKNVYDFYRKNESQFEFLTWYRQYDRHVDNCMKGLNVNNDNTMFGNEIVLQNTAQYICYAGLIDIDKHPKPAWNEFKKQTQFKLNS